MSEKELLLMIKANLENISTSMTALIGSLPRL